MEWNIVFCKEIDSTNLEVRRLSKQGAEAGLVVSADMQNAGRGRSGRTWDSPAGGNLYFSVLLRPDFSPEKAPMLTLLMAYSVANALDKVIYPEGLSVQIKWPNDIILSRKKICGILTEMNLEQGQIEDVIIGVGINIDTRQFSETLQDKATSIVLESGIIVDKESLLKQILQEFGKHYEDFLQTQNLSLIQEKYNQLLVNRDCEVMVLEQGNEYRALALGINENGELVVQKEDGKTETVYAGEVSVRGIYGYV